MDALASIKSVIYLLCMAVMDDDITIALNHEAMSCITSESLPCMIIAMTVSALSYAFCVDNHVQLYKILPS